LRRRAFVTAKVRANFNLRGSQDVLRLWRLPAPRVRHWPPIYVDRPCALATRHDHMDTCDDSSVLLLLRGNCERRLGSH
jgi:hypothetical protein